MLWKALKPCSAVFTRVCVCFSIWGCRTLQVFANQLSLLVLLFPGMLDGKTSDHIFSTTAVLKVPLFISSLCSKPVFYMLRFYWSVDAWVGLLQVIYNYRTDLTHTSNPKKKKKTLRARVWGHKQFYVSSYRSLQNHDLVWTNTSAFHNFFKENQSLSTMKYTRT